MLVLTAFFRERAAAPFNSRIWSKFVYSLTFEVRGIEPIGLLLTCWASRPLLCHWTIMELLVVRGHMYNLINCANVRYDVLSGMRVAHSSILQEKFQTKNFVTSNHSHGLIALTTAFSKADLCTKPSFAGRTTVVSDITCILLQCIFCTQRESLILTELCRFERQTNLSLRKKNLSLVLN